MSTSLAAFSARLRTLANERLLGEIQAELIATGLTAEAKAKALVSERLKVRTGRLRNSIASSVKVKSDSVELRLQAGGRSAPYGQIQEKGGTVTAKRSRFLAIPTGPALTGAGVSRFRSPRSVKGLRFISIHGGAAGLLVKDYKGRGKSGSGARSEVWYRLVRSVKITGKRFLADAMDQARAGLGARLALRIVNRLSSTAGGDGL